MFFRAERIERILKELRELKYVDTTTIEQLKMKEGLYHKPVEVDECSTPWVDFFKNDRWGGKDQSCWFRFVFEIPENYSGKTVVHRIQTGHEDGWDASNPQFLIFKNGTLVQGLDVNHRETLLSEKAQIGEKYVIDLQAYGGMIEELSECKNLISVLDTKVEQLYYDIHVPLEVVKLLPKEDKERIDTIGYLEKAINLLDLRKPYSKEFNESVEEAIAYLTEEFYGQFCEDRGIVAKCVGHTHIDVAWLWDLAQTRQKVQRSFATVLELMKQYPEYIFMSSQPQLYQFLKEERPELYAAVKKSIEEGRWEPEGGMWVEADCNLSSGESLVRQIIHGKRFFREEFGVENKILWLPDVFGYSAALPQILKKSGIDYFMTTKISWNEYNKLPYDSFKWAGLDGSEVLTHFITTANFDNLPERYFTTYNGFIDAPSVKGAWERYQQKDLHDEVLISFGYGDGGGGPTKEMLETARRLEKGIPGIPVVQMSTATEYFETLDERVGNSPRLPKWVGELYFEYHRGTLTSMARNKRYNRKSEFLYEDVEWLSTIGNLVEGIDYPKADIQEGWEIICLNQFHDIIPGSSIKKVYEDSKEQYEMIIEKGKKLKQKAMDAITSNIEIDEKSVVVYNPTSFNRNEIIDLDIDGERITFYADNIPAKGYKAFPIKDIQPKESEMVVTTSHLENKFFDIQLDENANITSLYDKRVQRQVLKEGYRANVIQAFEDKPIHYDAWDINIYYQEKMWEVNDVESIKVVEEGPLKGTLEIKKTFVDSTITQLMTIYRDIDRIDFETTVDWKEKQVLLKAAFPVDIHAEKATYDIQFGNVERPTHWNTSWDTAKFEVCGHKWADLSEDAYGVSLLNDCKYGHDIKDGVMRLTLLKSATSPNEDADREVHHFTYSIYPHTGNWKKAKTVEMGYRLNCPVYTTVIDKQEGDLPKELSFVSIDQENVIMEVVKQAEESNEVILRVYECYNRRTKAKINFFKEIKAVYECDLEERHEMNELVVKSGVFEFDIKPYEIKTFKLNIM
ncbi:alpha-mannosidase [Vallitalea okinawensis]|uniref:alpha-mannosidase n=1 Tax=Vallitalea okinawensis TaxID=2078660 RepID=UPI000CFB1857|nr:alpha-mannosidase [Vallitalea okinawensis]